MSKTNVLLLALLVFLSGGWFVLEKPWATDRFDLASARRKAPIFPGFEPAKASKVELKQTKPGGMDWVVLERGPGGWQVPSLSNFRANDDTVARLLERIRGMLKGDLVTDDPGKHQKYRVNEAEAPRVTVRDASGRVLADFFQGRLTLDPNEAKQGQKLTSLNYFVRAQGSNEVYRLDDFQPIEPIRASDWIPRGLYRFDVAAIQTMMIHVRGKAPIALNRKSNGEWFFGREDAGAKADRERCETFARSFASIYLEDVSGPYLSSDASKYGFDQPRIQIEAELTGNTHESLLIGNDAPPDSTGGETVYATGGVAKNHVARVFKSSLAALEVTQEQLAAPVESAPASVPATDTQPASAPGSKPSDR